MKKILALVVMLVAGCTPAPEAPAPAVAAPAAAPTVEPATVAPPPPAPVADPGTEWERRLGNLPPDAAEVIGRVEACTHFSGEINGDQSERDREVAAKMTELKCDTIGKESAMLRDLYGDRPDVIEALTMATEGAR